MSVMDVSDELIERLRQAKTPEEAQDIGRALLPIPDPFPNEDLADRTSDGTERNSGDPAAEDGAFPLIHTSALPSPVVGSPRRLRLNIASGPNCFPGWLNLDKVDMSPYLREMAGAMPEVAALWPGKQGELAKAAREGLVEFKTHDLRLGFGEYADGAVDAIYLGQCVEHLNVLYELPNLLCECFRMLRPGGILRITTPDIEKLLAAYNAGEMGKFAPEQPAFYVAASPLTQLSYLMFGACGPQCTTERYEGHFHCFERAHLAAMLRGSGFSEIAFFEAQGESLDLELMAGVHDEGLSHSMCCEARRS